MTDKQLIVLPLTVERWDDFEKLFGPRGACGGCWCMFWRLSRAQFEAQKGAGNRRAMHDLVESEVTPGLLGYLGHQPAGWISLAPRPEFPVMGRSRVLKPVDDQPVWSVVCFFIAKAFRRSGLALQLLQAGVDFAYEHGAQIVEGYPKDAGTGQLPDPFIFTGRASTFIKAGFIEVARRSPTRPIFRHIRPSTG
jgi:GNAT superfamily N-acetyltransferase